MRTLGFAIGVGNYKSQKLKRVPFAEKDAKDFRNAFIAQGCKEGDFQLLLTADATRTTMDYRLRRFLESAEKDDTLVIFYAGHGLFAHGRNFLTCVDSELDDVVRTCVAVDELFELFKASRSTRIAIFLDACH